MHYVVSEQASAKAPAIVLIHGLFGDLDNLKALGKSLENDYRVIRVDVPNHGKSPHTDKMDYATLATDIHQLLTELDISAAYLVGHSMGGKIAMATALAYPESVKGLVVADIAPVAYQSRHDKVFAALKSLPNDSIKHRADALAHLLAADIDEGTAQFLLKALARGESGFKWKMNLDGLKRSYPDIIGWHNRDRHYTGPCLFVRGGDSDYVTSQHRTCIIRQFPKVTAKTIQGTGHWLHAQKPAIFNRIVKDFIDRQVTKT